MKPTQRYKIGDKVSLLVDGKPDGIQYKIYSVSDLGVYLHLEEQSSQKAKAVASYWDSKLNGPPIEMEHEAIEDESPVSDEFQQWITSILKTTKKN